ncbi:MAG: hypothetical protein ABEH56_08880 [Salinirussus sp.]
MTDIRTRPLSDRVVLLALADLSVAGETPAHTARLMRTCNGYVDAVEADVLGRASEAEINRALNRLEADGRVEVTSREDTSPVGKGRPQYAIADDPAEVLDALAEDDSVGPLATEVAESV